MGEDAFDLSKARILLSNDDGINATGLGALERIARELSDDIWVVAPESEQSGSSHSLTLRQPMRLRRITERRFAVDGTPTDCVLFAVRKVMADRGPDLVLSGVNRGGNLGDDVTYSGTVAAAMEGALLGIRSIALSQLVDGPHRAKWQTAEHHAPDLIRRLLAIDWPSDSLVNVNFPDVPAGDVTGVEIAPQGKRKIGAELEERRDPRGYPYYWFGRMRDEPESDHPTDITAVRSGAISVTPLHLNLTDWKMMEEFGKALA
ncbi:MAG: 5'/3'-nucleotidase SurE [Alphaproteobacteria bacterium]|nr:5'/3'-nucleotidase SurE [Alphaproteobacteria bacterium]